MSQIISLASGASGTVTSIAAGTGITATPNPIVGAGTIALSTPVTILNGGTNATTYTQANGIVTYNGTRLVNYPGPQISTSGVYTNSAQPAFHVYVSTVLNNATGDGTLVTVPYDTVVFDNTASFVPGINAFVAPVSGRYMFGCSVYLNNILAANTALVLYINIDATTYEIQVNPYAFTPTPITNYIQTTSVFANVNAGANCFISVQVYGAGKVVNIQNGANSAFFWGYLVC